LHEFKELIARLAMDQKWSLTQIQYAEDLIDALFEGGTQALTPPGLCYDYDVNIKDLFFKAQLK
jgi:hypothetical protein